MTKRIILPSARKRTWHWLRHPKKEQEARKTTQEQVATLIRAGNAKRNLTPFRLPDDTKSKLQGFADKDCWQCHGDGIKGWNKEGTVADICRCVHVELARREKVYTEVQKRLSVMLLGEATQEVEKFKKEGSPNPTRPCMVCQKLSDSDGQEFLSPNLPPGQVCPMCADSRQVPLTDEEWAKFLAYRRSAAAQAQIEEFLKDRQKKSDEIAEAAFKPEVPVASKPEDRHEAVSAAPSGEAKAEGDGY